MKRIHLLSFITSEVVVRNVISEVERVVESNLNPGSWFVAEVGESHGRGDVDRCEEPEENDREESAHREDDESAATVNDCSDEEKYAEQ